jgi:hypothetical protein
MDAELLGLIQSFMKLVARQAPADQARILCDCHAAMALFEAGETAAGRAEYESRQREFTARGEPLRDRLLALTERLLEAAA